MGVERGSCLIGLLYSSNIEYMDRELISRFNNIPADHTQITIIHGYHFIKR